MLVQGLHDFTPRKADSSQTLPFLAGDILLFLESYPKDRSWLLVVNPQGRIGYIPRNYVAEVDDANSSRHSALTFLQGAIFEARREKLGSLRKLEGLLDDVRRPEYRGFQTRLLRQALKCPDEHENDVEIEDGTTYTCDTDYKQRRDGGFSLQSPPTRETDSMISGPLSSRTGPKSAVEKQGARMTFDLPGVTSPKEPIRRRVFLTDSQNRNTPGTGRDYSLPYSPSSEHDFERMAVKLIKIVQESGGLDVKRSETVVHRILYHMKNHPVQPEGINSVLRVLERPPTSSYSHSLRATTTTGDEDDDSSSYSTSPGHRVKRIVNYLSRLGQTQQSLNTRGYIEDETVLLEKLDQLRNDLTNLDGVGLKRALISEPRVIEDLMEFYQSEGGRTGIKFRMIEIFSTISGLDAETRATLCKSALPILLGKDLMVFGGAGDEGSRNPEILALLATTLTSLLSPRVDLDHDLGQGASLPATHLDALGQTFVTFLFNYLDRSPSQSQLEIGDEIASTKSAFVSLLLAYNLQFTPRLDENILIKTMAGRRPCQLFMDALLNLFDTGVDPLRRAITGSGTSLDKERIHSVMKLLQDMFSSKLTSEHFHKADMKRMMDIIYDNVFQLGPGNRKRTDNLQLLWLVWRNRVFNYRMNDIREALVGILLEEDHLSVPDQRIVKSMSKEFPTIFKKPSEVNIIRKSSPI